MDGPLAMDGRDAMDTFFFFFDVMDTFNSSSVDLAYWPPPENIICVNSFFPLSKLLFWTFDSFICSFLNVRFANKIFHFPVILKF